jgi:putative Holliday junction resolvase
VIAKLASLGDQLECELFVVGIARGEARFRDFAERLRQKTCKEVVLWDEALTTVEAAEQLRAAGRKRRDAEREIDMVAAAVILQSYLDRARRAS